MEVIQEENAFVMTLVGKKNVLFINVSTELDIFTLFEIAALIYKAPNLKLTKGVSYISLKTAKLQEIAHKTLPLRETLKALGGIYMITVIKIFSPTKS